MKITTFIVKKGSPAFELVKRGYLEHEVKPGQITLCTEEELESWRRDVEVVVLRARAPK